ncbi:MAG: GHKL domain-containing protein [Acidobacteria bacterium]|nr:MAG: GHKL domain-containing protein [Acidobacteriota bacterium]
MPRLSLRSKIFLHLLAVHVILAVIAFIVLMENRLWLLAVEVLFALSLSIGYSLLRAFFVPLDLIRTGAELMEEQDFSSHFREVGQPEMDALIRVYNNMVDRLRQERLKLEEQTVLLDQIFRVSPTGMITLDFDGRLSTLNPSAEALLSLTAEDVKGKRPQELDSTLGRELVGLPVGESRVLPLQGRRRVRVSRGEFFDQGFARSFFLLEELTDELRASEKAAYRKLIRMMSHEINNSVGSVASLLDSCRHYTSQVSEADRSDFENALSVARSRLENLNTFTKGFADVVRLPAPEPHPCDLRALMDDVLVLLRPEMEERNIACRWELCEPLPAIPLDKNQMEQVLVNVLRNAMEAMEDGGGSIALSLSQSDGQPLLSIQDSGTGVSQEVARSLFTPFFSTKKNGRGLGLTIVHEILSRHGFDFGLQDRNGAGAEFWIKFGMEPVS